MVFHSTRKEAAANQMASVFDMLRWCPHSGGLDKLPCPECVKNLWLRSKSLSNTLPTVANLGIEICETVEKIDSQVCAIAKHVALLIQSAVSVNRVFHSRCEKKMPISALNYNELYKVPRSAPLFGVNICVENGSGDCNGERSVDSRGSKSYLGSETVSYSNAAKTGELYPRRPLVCPRISFKNGDLGEGWNERCAKDYLHHPFHSAGLFKIQ